MYNRSIQPSDIDNLSNAELLALSENAPKVHPDAGVVRLTSGTVAKPSQDMDEDAPDPSEAAALDLVFSETTIPVPRVRRVLEAKRRPVHEELDPARPLLGLACALDDDRADAHDLVELQRVSARSSGRERDRGSGARGCSG